MRKHIPFSLTLAHDLQMIKYILKAFLLILIYVCLTRSTLLFLVCECHMPICFF